MFLLESLYDLYRSVVVRTKSFILWSIDISCDGFVRYEHDHIELILWLADFFSELWNLFDLWFFKCFFMSRCLVEETRVVDLLTDYILNWYDIIIKLCGFLEWTIILGVYCGLMVVKLKMWQQKLIEIALEYTEP